MSKSKAQLAEIIEHLGEGALETLESIGRAKDCLKAVVSVLSTAEARLIIVGGALKASATKASILRSGEQAAAVEASAEILALAEKATAARERADRAYETLDRVKGDCASSIAPLAATDDDRQFGCLFPSPGEAFDQTRVDALRAVLSGLGEARVGEPSFKTALRARARQIVAAFDAREDALSATRRTARLKSVERRWQAAREGRDRAFRALIAAPAATAAEALAKLSVAGDIFDDESIALEPTSDAELAGSAPTADDVAIAALRDLRRLGAI
jgi:hypothetical protein